MLTTRHAIQLALVILTCERLSAEGLQYPESRRDHVIDTLHGVEITDPYRWLEDDYSDETEAWVTAQNKVTFEHLESIPARTQIRDRLTELTDYERFGTPFKAGGRYFFTKNEGLQNQSVLYTARSLEEEATVLLDPNQMSADGTVSLSSYEVSDDGEYIAYSISVAGSDWLEWKVREIETGEDLDDHLRWSKFSGASWSKDNQGFYYSRYPKPKEDEEFQAANLNQKVYYHRLGTPQSEDRLVYERPDQPKWGFSAGESEDKKYLLLSVWEGAGANNAFFYKDLDQPDAPVVELLKDFDARYSFLDNEGSTFWFRTDLDAPRGRVIAIDVTNLDRENWKTIIEQSPDTLRSVSVVGDEFIAVYMHNAHSVVRRFQTDGTALGELELPGVGSVGGFSGKREDRETFFSFNTYTTPPTVFRYDFDESKFTVFREPRLTFEPSRFETRQVFFKSKDGTEVPMFIVSRRDLKLDGNHPTLLYGYGGFNISLLPRFSPSVIAWLELGGVYAVANLRGGGEFGEEWHEAGKMHLKQNVFDDFISAAEWLIDNKYTSPDKLAIAGGSNGGLLVGACMIQRPDLFAAALPAVGVMDMLRFQKFTIGWAWMKEYGNPDVEADFKVLHAYSPLHNLEKGTAYPATLITTADHDDRVVPAHSFKFAAALQHAQKGTNPTLIRIETDAGHGAGKPTDKRIAETADEWAFLVKELDMDVHVDAD
ncbi:MAG: prolyl oligopeptidase family serine peptidase [Verrucomicrobiota bacterium]